MTINSYLQGLLDEKELMERLALTHTVTPSTDWENKALDVDLHLDGSPASIKCQDKAADTGNFCFETSVEWRETGEITPSWYHNSKVDIYIIKVKQTVYKVWKQKLTDYVDHNGFDRVSWYSAKAKAAQDALGHPHSNCEVGLISIDKLLAAGVAEEMQVADKGPTKRKHFIPKL